MKKICIILLALLLCLPNLAGCAKEDGFYRGPMTVSRIASKESTAKMVSIVLKDKTKEEILSILNRGEWINGVYDCGYSFIFSVSEATLQYQPQMGVFNDLTNKRVLILADADRERINAFLGATPESLGYKSTIQMMRCNADGHGVSVKTIEGGEFADRLADALAALSEVGIVEEAISEEWIDWDSDEVPAEPGTLWIEVDSVIYRMNAEMTTISRTEGYLGIGYVLDMSEEIVTLISDAWYYYPYHYYSGSYDVSADSLTVEQTFDALSLTDISVREIKMAADAKGPHRIVLEVSSKMDLTVEVLLDCRQSDDNLGTGDQKKVTLKAGQPQTVELTFSGFFYDYQVDVTADNTRVSLWINVP